jgi:hypothetical protein
MCTLRLRFATGTFVFFCVALSTRSLPAGEQKSLPALQKARLDAARKAYEQHWDKFEKAVRGAPNGETLCIWSKRWLNAQRGMSADKDVHPAALEAHLERMKKLEERVAQKVKVDPGLGPQAAAAEYYRVEAELLLYESKAKSK